MEHVLTEQRCNHEGLTYSHGTGLCVEKGCMVCNDGKWEEDTSHDAFTPTS